MITIGSFVLVLGVVVFVHELGHYLLARMHGVRVETFSIGMGPKILKWRRGPTLFCASAIPVGGYVRLAGGRLLDEATGAPDELRSKSRWVRAQIYLAGPLANVVLAITLGTIAQKYAPLQPASDDIGQGVVEMVLPGSPADRAGFRVGDRLLGAGVSCDCTLADIRTDFDTNTSPTVDVEVLRNDTTVLVSVPHPPGRAGQFDRLGLVLRTEPATSTAVFVSTTAVVLNDARPQAALTAQSASANLGAALPVRPGAISAARNVTTGILTVISELPAEVREAIDDGQPERPIVGPIGIARLCGQAAQSGWAAFVALAAVISLGLAFTNLLPIPVADGGQICILGVEAICRRDAGIRTRTALAFVGILILIALMGTATFFDLRAIW